MAQVAYDRGGDAEPYPTIAPRTSTPDDTLHVRATPDEFGGETAQGLEKAGQGAFVASKFFGQVAADNASNEFQERVGKILYGDPNKQTIGPDDQPQQDTGYYGLKGRAALDARPGVEEQIDALLKDTKNGLQTPEQQLQFDNFSRRYRSYVIGDVGRHADQQAGTWFGQVNTADGNLAMSHIAQSINNPTELQHGFADLLNARVKQAQLAGGGDDLIKQASVQARAEGIAAWTRAVAVNDPAKALRILDKYKDDASVIDRATGVSYYDALAGNFRSRAAHQNGISLQRRSMADNYGGVPQAPVAPASLDQIQGVIDGQESGHGVNTQTSSTGAVGRRQIEPATFQQYAKPGENIHVEADNVAVGNRILADYYKKYNGDPYRVAVAYFSGPGNVAPEGSATPWIKNNADPTGKTVASYVNDIASRLGAAPASISSAQAATERAIMFSDEPDEVKQYALAENQRFFHEATIAQEADTKARKDANDAARDTYTTQIFSLMQSNPQGLLQLKQKIELDPHLEGPTKIALSNFMTAKLGLDEGTQYGEAFPEIYRRILLPAGDPQRIADPNAILVAGAPGGGLTPRGTERLMQVYAQSRKDIDQAAVNQTKSSLIQYAKSKLSFDQETLAPGFQLKDPKGAQIFNAQFVPKFEAAYDAWIKAGKSPFEFLTQENVDKLMTGMRPKSAMTADRLAATGQASGDTANIPMPEAPAGVAPEQWHDILVKPPTMATGQVATPQQYGMAIKLLAESPSEQTKTRFNKWFGAQGAMADDVLARLKGEKPKETPQGQPHREPESGELTYQGSVAVDKAPPAPAQWWRGLPPTLLPPEMRQ